MRSAAMLPSERLPAIDYVKAAAIVAVALTHAIPAFEGPLTRGAEIMFALTSFHVPAFLLIAGFLSMADTPVGIRRVAARLVRLLVPYVIASAIAWGLGFAQIAGLHRLLFVLATGAMLGHYYFVPMLTLDYLLLPILSRAGVAALVVAGIALELVAEAMWIEPSWRISQDFFWGIRDPLIQLHLGHFVLGVLAGRYRSTLPAVFRRRRLSIGVASSLTITAFAAVAIAVPTWSPHPAAHSAYMLAIVSLIAALTPDRAAPAAVRFLSDATLPIYLYHWFVYPLVAPLTRHTPLGVRMLVLATCGLSFGSLVVVAGRRVLGTRSRMLLGA